MVAEQPIPCFSSGSRHGKCFQRLNSMRTGPTRPDFFRGLPGLKIRLFVHVGLFFRPASPTSLFTQSVHTSISRSFSPGETNSVTSSLYGSKQTPPASRPPIFTFAVTPTSPRSRTAEEKPAGAENFVL